MVGEGDALAHRINGSLSVQPGTADILTELGNSWVGGFMLYFIGCLAASLTPTHYMSALPLVTTEMSPDSARCSLGGHITTGWKLCDNELVNYGKCMDASGFQEPEA